MSVKTPIVIDITSNLVKAGFANEDSPSVVFSMNVGPRYTSTLEEAYNLVFQKLNVNPKEHPILLTDVFDNSPNNRTTIALFMFNTFQVPYLLLHPGAVLSLFSTNRQTGLVIHSERDETCIIPVLEGAVLPYATVDTYGKKDVANYLTKLLGEAGHTISEATDAEMILDQLGYVALDFDQEMKKAASGTSLNKTHTLSNGQTITLNNQHFMAPEVMINPNFIGYDHYGLAMAAHDCITQSHIDMKEDLLGNIILAGENTLYPGLPERLKKEMTALTGRSIDITALPNRKNAAWLGGKLLASQSHFTQMSISKEHYDMEGPSVINRQYA